MNRLAVFVLFLALAILALPVPQCRAENAASVAPNAAAPRRQVKHKRRHPRRRRTSARPTQFDLARFQSDFESGVRDGLARRRTAAIGAAVARGEMQSVDAISEYWNRLLAGHATLSSSNGEKFVDYTIGGPGSGYQTLVSTDLRFPGSLKPDQMTIEARERAEMRLLELDQLGLLAAPRDTPVALSVRRTGMRVGSMSPSVFGGD